MATSGTLSPGGGYQGRTLYMSWSLASQSVTSNSSTITWTLYATGGSSSYYYHHAEKLWIYGAWRHYNTTNTKRYTGAIASGSITIYHDTEGNGSFGAELYGAIFTSSQNIAGSASWSLPQIARASSVTCPSKFIVEETGEITLTRNSTNFTHTVSNSLGDDGMSATLDIATSFTYTPPISLFDSPNYANVTERSGSISVQTKSGTTNIGSAVISDFTVVLPENSVTKPICNISNQLEEYNSSYLSRYGVLIAGKSRLRTTCSSSANISATIANHYVSIPGSSATVDSDNNIITDYLKASSSKATLSYYVKDSRGFTSSVATVLNPYQVVEYRAPSIISFIALRVNDDGNEDPVNGENVRFKINYYVDPIAISDEYEANKATVKVYLLERDSDGNVVSRTKLTAIDGSDLIINNNELTEIVSGNYPIANSFDFEATIVDELTNNEVALGSGSRASIFTAKALMSFYKSDGVTFGRVAEEAGFNVLMNAYFGMIANFDDDIYVNSDKLEELWNRLI